MKINPLVSIIIPLRTYNESLKKILYTIYNRRFRDFEVIIVSPEESNTLNKLRRKYQFRLFYNKDGKSASRNFGASKAKGRYLFHLDNDMLLNHGLLAECISLCKTKKLKAVAVTETAVDKIDTLYGRVRILEKIIVAMDKNIVAPRFIEKNLFEELGGFNEKLDPIDDGDLLAKIQEKGLSYAVTKNKIVIIGLRNRYSFTSRLRYMFERGQKASLFRFIHSQSKQLRPFHRLNPYFKNINLLIRNPLTSFVLIVLKMFDLIALEVGSILMTEKDKKLLFEIKNKKIFEEEAGSYQEEFYENTRGGRFVDDQEKKIVKKYLEKLDKKKTLQILDIGAGGGRWSKMMLDLFPKAKITAFDLSGGMVSNLNNKYKEYGQKFHAVIGDMQHLPFRDNSYDLVISIRSIKYAKDQNKVFSEIYRVLTPNGKAIIELPNFNFIYRFIRRFNFFGKLSGYASRIQLLKKEEIEESLKENKLFVEHSEIHFTVPATLYKKINNTFILKLLNLIDTFLNKDVFGRSIFIQMKKNNYSLTKKPLVSIIIPTHNSAKFLDSCLSSIKNQTYKNMEVIIADNNSSDETKKKTQSYKYFYVNTIKPAPQVCLQRNLGAKKSKGKYLLFLDHDMELPSNFLENAIIEIEKNPSIDAWYIPEKIYANNCLLTEIRNFENECSRDTVIAAARLIKKSKFFSTSDQYDPKLSGGPADWDMDIQLKELDCKFKTMNIYLYHHEENLTIFRYITKKFQYVRGLEVYKEKWNKHDKGIYNSIVKKQFDPLYRSIFIFFENGKWKRTIKKFHLYLLLAGIVFFKGIQYHLRKSKSL